MTEKITMYFHDLLSLSDEDTDLLRFGLESIICDYTDFLSVLVISMFLKDVANTLSYIILLAILRSRSGGFHAKTKHGCLILYVMIYMMYYLIRISLLPIPIYWFLFILGAMYTLIFVPVEHIHMPLASIERSKSRQRIFVYIVCLTICSIYAHMHKSVLFKTIVLVVVINALSMAALQMTSDWRRI